MHKNLVKMRYIVPEICSRTDRLTERQTGVLITLRSSSEGRELE